MILSVTTWADLPCGCSSSDDGWWIVTRRCIRHRRVLSPFYLDEWSRTGFYGEYGPVQSRE